MLGTASIITGLIGIVVPVLPTTPFLLLGASCYMRSSKRLYDALMANRFASGYLKGYLEGRGMSRRVKIFTISLLWIVLGITAFLADSMVLRVVLLAVAIGVTTHIILIRRRRKVLPE